MEPLGGHLSDVGVAAVPAGEYTLGTSMAGTQPLILTLTAGDTYYIHARLTMRGGGTADRYEREIYRTDQY